MSQERVGYIDQELLARDGSHGHEALALIRTLKTARMRHKKSTTCWKWWTTRKSSVRAVPRDRWTPKTLLNTLLVAADIKTATLTSKYIELRCGGKPTPSALDNSVNGWCQDHSEG